MSIFGKITVKYWGVGVVACAIGLPVAAAGEGIANTKHNLSASGPGSVKAAGSDEVCVFCHTPHNANPSRSLWNHELPGTSYTLYASSTLKAQMNQPTGSSRLCLSCHDGTLALGALRVPPASSALAFGAVTGRASLGTDLSDDHPMSFTYDQALAVRRGELAEPSAVPSSLPLDEAQQLQCTTCHDPHRDTYRAFLRVDDRAGALCTACHQITGWSGSLHATSNASWSGVGASPWATSGYTTVAEHGCENCHQPHAAAHPPRLLAKSQETGVCLSCHNGSVASKDLEPELRKFSGHPMTAAEWVHDPKESPSTMSRHVTCTDCHNPHHVDAAAAAPPLVSGRLKGVRGVDLAGSVVEEARYEYEVCLKCHGLRDQTAAGVIRQDNTRNIRLEIDPGNASYHPVAAVGRDPNIQGLQPGYSASSVMTCTECHNTDDWVSGAARPRGPHGSRFEPILEREYQQVDPVIESPQSFALCYKCHTRSTLLGSGRFPHEAHLRQAQASCAVCHDAHGSRANIRLINFMLRDKTGAVIVSENRNGLLQFTPAGSGRGECSLRCHGEDHDRKSY